MTRHETNFRGDDRGPRIAPSRISALLSAATDIAIVLDANNVVQHISVNPENRELGCLDHWEGRPIDDFLTVESRPKLKARLTALRKGDDKGARPLEINHVDNANWEFPIRYTAQPTGELEDVILLGRDLRPIAEVQQQLVKAQMALEKDYEKSRAFETRYRVVMESVDDALAIVDANTARILSINSSAARLVGDSVDSLNGASFAQLFEGRQRKGFVEELNAAASAQESVTAEARRNRSMLTISPTLFRSAGEMNLLCRIEAAEKSEPVTEDLRDALHALFESASEGVVITTAAGDIRYANEGFLVFVDAAQLSEIRDTSFGEYLTRGAVDLKVLLENAARTGRLRMYATKLKGSFGTQLSVEISATHLKERSEPLFAFIIRDVSRLEANSETGVNDESVRNVMELVGSAPLKDLVAATTDVVEKMCIETAVELTRNNRVAAAEMLGLSRQSLYVKLRKYGLLEKNDDE